MRRRKKLRAELEKEKSEILKLKSEMNQKTNQLHLIHRVKTHTKMLMSRMDLEEISFMPNKGLILRKLISMSGSQYEQDLIV